MRATTATIFIFTITAALFIAGCGGPKNPAKQLAKACERQIEQVKSEQKSGDTPVAESTQKFEENERLTECAGQPSIAATAAAEARKATKKAEKAQSSGDAKGKEEAKTNVLDDTALAAEREKFSQTCGSCHTLADAKTSGTFGPDIDKSKMDLAALQKQIEDGGGSMPPGLLKGDDAASMAAYIDQVRAG